MGGRGLRAKTQITFAEFLPFPLCLTGSLLGRMICNCINQILLIQQEPHIPMMLGHTAYATLVGAFFKIGQPLAGAVLCRNGICYAGRLKNKASVRGRQGTMLGISPCHCMWNYGSNCETPRTVAMKQCLSRILSSNCYEERLENESGNGKWMDSPESFR